MTTTSSHTMFIPAQHVSLGHNGNNWITAS
jgi:hemin uptake protein HemP